MEDELIRTLTSVGHQPFRVPDGYFESLAGRVMEQIPASIPATDHTEREAVAVIRSARRPMLQRLCVAAAILCAVILSGVAIFNKSNAPTHQQPTASTVPGSFAAGSAATTVDNLDLAADYAMMDNHDIYACLMND